MSRIISIGTAVPEFSAFQEDILLYMCKSYDDETISRKLRILFHSSGIESRYSVVPDFGNYTGNPFFFKSGMPDVEKRMELYKDNAASLAVAAVHNLFGKLETPIETFGITHLIAVTCTGLYAPGLESVILERLQLAKDIFTTSVNFLGCNAAFPAQKIADSFACSDKNARVLVVCVELCTIHFQPKDDIDNLLSNTIFGDGAAAALIVSDEQAQMNGWKGLKMGGFYSEIFDEGKNLMGWNVKPLNFEMVLDGGVPDFIGQYIKSFVVGMNRRLNITPHLIDKWAVHPGGRRILDQVKNKLELINGEMNDSYRVLKKYGNMSSPTILFILNEMMEKALNTGEKLMAIGFGPGIRVDAALYYYE